MTYVRSTVVPILSDGLLVMIILFWMVAARFYLTYDPYRVMDLDILLLSSCTPVQICSSY